ncbi:PAS domain-containing protein [Aeromonas caviae]|uniref:PAS domain-containing protein n=1 Tax=Aeromonas caviae TaxID=648 RepID=UPI00214ED2DB|nr:PAS domain-containing protein [Aeromonas caviae]MCR3891974.1 PAS domain-containing protein [Aeromonas caviae]
MKKSQVHLIDEEVDFPANEQLVSTTDLQGVITYANDHFCRVAGYSRAELIGQHHNMVRHPDMPKAAFADLWGKLKQGKPWRGMVKNRCKVGVTIGWMPMSPLSSSRGGSMATSRSAVAPRRR